MWAASRLFHCVFRAQEKMCTSFQVPQILVKRSGSGNGVQHPGFLPSRGFRGAAQSVGFQPVYREKATRSGRLWRGNAGTLFSGSLRGGKKGESHCLASFLKINPKP